MEKGLFITFEGCDGSGKTTVLKMLSEYFVQKRIEHVVTREPGGSLVAEKIRDIILNVNHNQLAYTTEALLYAASRAQHFQEIIKPTLHTGKVLLCDRFLDSSLVYQGIARKLGVASVLAINEFAIEKTLPDKTIYLDIKPEIGLKRIAKNKLREVNRLDLENLAFHKQVYQGYQQIILNDPKRFKVIDANRPIEEVFQDVLNTVMEVYNG